MTDINISKLDAEYKPFPSYADWISQVSLDPGVWEQLSLNIKDRGAFSQAALDRARRIATRAAAIDTGALEGLYESDRGFTYTVAVETTAWETEIATRGEQVRPLFEAQLHGYEYVLSFATGSEPISEAAIRELHAQICAAQETYRVGTAVGIQEQPLPKGQYKSLPNHVRTRSGENHSYAPVDMTPFEMQRLVSVLRSEQFLSSHPVLQAAYAHYALVVIHPFADGNGRVARALASAFTYRAISAPIVILADQKVAYLDALEAADKGSYAAFTSFMLRRSTETIELVVESLRAASTQEPEDAISQIEDLFRDTFLSQSEVDEIGGRLILALQEALKEFVSRYSVKNNVAITDRPILISLPAWNDSYRLPVDVLPGLQIDVGTKHPASAKISHVLILWLPKFVQENSSIHLRFNNGSEGFSARIRDLHPSISQAVRIRLGIFVSRVLSEMLMELRPIAEKALRKEA